MRQDLVSKEFSENVLFLSQYHTHTSYFAEAMHWLSGVLLWPSSIFMHTVAFAYAPDAGQYKDNRYWKSAVRALSFAGLCFFMFTTLSGGLTPNATVIMLGLLSTALGYLIRYFDFKYRPLACYLINKSDNDYTLPPTHLHIRTHNLALVPTTVARLTDIRDPYLRADELVKAIKTGPKSPDILFCQEAPLHNEDAVQVLVKGLSEIYPYIIYNVAPGFLGFTSGSLVASRFPIKFESFEPFKHMVPPHDGPLRGILIVSVQTWQGRILFANVHTQSLSKPEYAQAREKQLQDLYDVAKKTSDKLECPIVVLGDMNTSRMTASGRDALNPPTHVEIPVLNKLDKLYDDPFLKNHTPDTGKRTKGTSFFLPQDAKVICPNNPEELKEPTGTWYGEIGASGSAAIYSSDSTMKKKEKNKPEMHTPRVSLVDMRKSPCLWGTSKWTEKESTFTARFDRILFLKNTKQSGKLDADVEIRHNIPANGQQSASTDHLPVDAFIKFKH